MNGFISGIYLINVSQSSQHTYAPHCPLDCSFTCWRLHQGDSSWHWQSSWGALPSWPPSTVPVNFMLLPHSIACCGLCSTHVMQGHCWFRLSCCCLMLSVPDGICGHVSSYVHAKHSPVNFVVHTPVCIDRWQLVECTYIFIILTPFVSVV